MVHAAALAFFTGLSFAPLLVILISIAGMIGTDVQGEIVDEVGFPEGVVNMVHGSRDVVNAMLDHPDIAGISFVGSTPTARHIYRKCGETGKRVQALGGAKNIVAVMPPVSGSTEPPAS